MFLVMVAAACSKDDERQASPVRTSPAEPKRERSAYPTTGVPVLARDTDDLERTLRDLEERLAQGAQGKEVRPPSRREVERAVDRARKLAASATAAVRAESREQNHAMIRRLRQDLAQVREEKAMTALEVAELKRRLAAIQEGVEPVPAGRTVAGLRDRVADLEVGMGKLVRKERDTLARLKVHEDRRISGENPPLEDSMATRVRTRLEALVRRAEALGDRLE